MLWESGSNSKDGSNEEGWGSSKNPLFSQVTPVLVPAHSATKTVHQTVPVVVPDVEELKEQFQQQQNMLTQIKETIKENESVLNSKGKKVEAYANRLTQIRARAKMNEGKGSSLTTSTPQQKSLVTKTISKKSSKENLSKDADTSDKQPSSTTKLTPKGKIGELKKKLEESKLKFEERTGKEVSETKKIESIVENLRMQLEERDLTIQEFQKMVEQPSLNAKSDASSRRNRKSEGRTNVSKSTQTTKNQPTDESIEIIALQNRIYELEAKTLDLEESLKEKESVIDARTQAVTLLSQDLSIKGKNTLECLEETRQEMRAMQSNFVVIENQLKKELLEKDNELSSTEEKLHKLESINSELNLANVGLREKLGNLDKKLLEFESDCGRMSESIVQVQNDEKVAELNNKINVLNKELDDSNKSMIKMKLEHKNKIKSLNKTIEKLKENSDDKAEIHRLQTKLDEFELVKEGLQNKIAELEEEKATEKALKDKINELEALIRQQSNEIDVHMHSISKLEKDKQDLQQSAQDQSILVENLYAKIQNLESESSRKDSQIIELTDKLIRIEDEFKIKLDAVKSEHAKEMDTLESYYNVRIAGSDRKEFEEYRISNELNNVQVEEQIEMLIREKQQLLEKLKSLSGVSSTESFNFETVDHSEFQTQSDLKPADTDSAIYCNVQSQDGSESKSREHHLQRITDEQQALINELQNAITCEKEKSTEYQRKIENLEESVRGLEESNRKLQPQLESASEEPSKNQKSNANVKNKIKKMQTELLASKKTIKEQNEKLDELNMKLEEKEKLIKDYIEKVELFEKDDWGRENDWKSTQDDFEHMQELQKKCLSLENSLIELNEDCERLRKENIEVVHLLSEEKVKRRKLLEKFQASDEPKVTLEVDSSEDQNVEWNPNDLNERILRLIDIIEMLDNKLKSLELRQSSDGDVAKLEELNSELREKLEWSNIVLTSKDTEIFRIQNLLEDSSKAVEDLRRDLKEAGERLTEKDAKLYEITKELQQKENQFEELSVNFEKLQDSVIKENERTALNESQLKQLMETVKEMESDAAKKENELREIQGILAEKNLDIHNLKQWLEQVNSDLTFGYKEHLENMDKCLRDKEAEFEVLLAEKNEWEEAKRNLISINEDNHNQKVELQSRNEALEKALAEKEFQINELKEKQKQEATQVESNLNETEELKMKVKKLAANLKKKVQNEKDLLRQIKEFENFIAEKESMLQKLQKDVTDVNEKWLTEKSEKDQFKNELSTILSMKEAAEMENSELREKMRLLEVACAGREGEMAAKMQKLEIQLQQVCQTSEQMRIQAEQDKAIISSLEMELKERAEKSCSDELKLENEELRKQLAGTCNKFEEIKFKYEELNMEKTRLETSCKELQCELEKLRTEMESLTMENIREQAKLQEQLVVLESLESDLLETRDLLKTKEDKLCFLEERRSSLEMKQEEMLKKIEEDSKNVHLINDLSNQIQLLLESENNLKSSLKSLDEQKRDLESKLNELSAGKAAVEKELKDMKDRSKNLCAEVDRLKDIETENKEMMGVMAKEAEKFKTLKMENKQKSTDIEKLMKDIQLLEADLKENIENSKEVEKSLNYKVEELLRENAALLERNTALAEMKSLQEQAGPGKQQKRKKSVTFKTDESELIQELKNKLQENTESLKQSNEEVKKLEMELLRERLKNEVSDVVIEAKEKVESLRSTPEKAVVVVQPSCEMKFDASTFFGSPTSAEANFFDHRSDPGLASQGNPDDVAVDYESLMWDDGWGTDGHLEEDYLSSKATSLDVPQSSYKDKYEALEKELSAIEKEKQKLEEEMQALQGKYAKAVKKLKEQKALSDKLQGEVIRLKSDAGFGGLDGAIMDELKSQIKAFETKEKELLKNLEVSKQEKEALLKRIEVLSDGNDKFMEMKERQNNEIEVWETKNRELLQEISELRGQLREQEPATSATVDQNILKENTELKNKIEGLEWENCELKEMLEEKQELLDARGEPETSEEKLQLAKEIAELSSVKEILEKKLADEEKKNQGVIGDLQGQVSALASENETLQNILVEMKKSDKAPQPAVTSAPVAELFAPPAATTQMKVFDYFKSVPANDFFSAVFQPVPEAPSIEPVIQKKVVAPVATSRDNDILEQLKQENELLKQQLNETQNIITTIQSERLEMAERSRAEYENALSFNLEEKNQALQKVYELEQALAGKIEEVNNMSARMRDLDQVLAVKTEELEAAARGRQELEHAFGIKTEESSQIWVRVNELEKILHGKTEELAEAGRRMVEFERALMAKGDELNTVMNNITALQEQLKMKEEESIAKSAAVADLESTLNVKTGEIERFVARLHELEKELERKDIERENMKMVQDDLAMQNMIPLESEIEKLNSALNEERMKAEELQRAVLEREDLLRLQGEEIDTLKMRLAESENRLRDCTLEYEKQRSLTEEYCDAKEKLEDLVSNLQTELETANMELNLSRGEVEEIRKSKEEAVAELECRIDSAKAEESRELEKLKREVLEKGEACERLLAEKERDAAVREEEGARMQNALHSLETHMESLKKELTVKDNDIYELGQALEAEQRDLLEARSAIAAKEGEIEDLKQALAGFQEEISSFRNFEKQVKELRMAHVKQPGSDFVVTEEGNPNYTNWTEHELAELNTRLQSDLDTALYMLHQRDIRCDELTFELMQLLEERDTLQLRLSTAIRINEELRCLNAAERVSYVQDARQENKDLVDQSNDRQARKGKKVQEEDLRELAQKISQLHSVGYIRDKTIQDETMQRHKDQMTLLGRVSDPDVTLSRDGRNSPGTVKNWQRGKSTPKVMHI